jgi:hypothetical protein
MAKHSRQPWPKKVVWVQDDVTHTRFYWLAVPEAEAKKKRGITAETKEQTVQLTGDVPKQMVLRLSDQLLDLDKPIRVLVNDREVFNRHVTRDAEVIRQSLRERADRFSAATAKVELNWE